MSKSYRAWREELVADLEGDVLEIGVGEGENLIYYRRASHVYAIEPNTRRAERARLAARQASMPVTIEVAPAEKLPYEDARFDHVVSSMVFCSVSDPVAALREIRRVLRPAGSLHMVEHVRPSNFAASTLFHLATPLWSRFAWNCHLDRPTVDTLLREGWQVEVKERRQVFVRLVAHPPHWFPGAPADGDAP